MQLEITCITFGISAFLSKGGVGIGIGASIGLYFMNIFSNLTKEAEFLKYITPFAYTDSGYITKNSSLDFKYIAFGIIISLIMFSAGFIKYNKKDIK
jgi:ABC-2 type transport system permease protein